MTSSKSLLDAPQHLQNTPRSPNNTGSKSLTSRISFDLDLLHTSVKLTHFLPYHSMGYPAASAPTTCPIGSMHKSASVLTSNFKNPESPLPPQDFTPQTSTKNLVKINLLPIPNPVCHGALIIYSPSNKYPKSF